MSSYYQILEEDPFPSKFSIVRFFTECVHHTWPTHPAVLPWSPILAHADREKALRCLDIDIEKMEATLTQVNIAMQRTMRNVRHRRNYQTAINRLPVEVLCQIFSHANEGRVRAKLSISHTCAFWRDVAIDYPHMWTSIDLNSVSRPEFVPDILGRAKGLPLQLQYYDWEQLDQATVDRCAELMHNTEQLKLRVGTKYMRHSGTWLADQPAPILRCLEIAMSGGIAIFPRLFGNEKPCLMELTLTNCRLAWSPRLYVGLTKLKIRSHYVMQSSDPSDRDIRQVFKDSPNLEELELVNCGPVHDSEVSEIPKVTPLPRLRILRLRLHVSDVSFILSAISPPSTMRLSVQCATSGTFRDLVGSNHLLNFSEFRSLEIDGSTYRILGFTDVGGKYPSFDLSTYGSHSFGVFDRFLFSLGSVYPLPLLHRLRVHSLHTDRIVWLLHSTPSIVHLELVSEAMEILSLLSHHYGELDSQFAQSLCTLAIERVYLDAETLMDIADMLHFSPKLRALYLHKCTSDLTPDEVVEFFLQDVATVQWSNEPLDGYDVDDEYDEESYISSSMM
ncbi:hypothetical protein BKA93DRAFT_89420 [Sparassis latifolia]|uniref:F-box domain-containing protein n=1 Tax=Sparassis crispa TaxID=139825 RepID=A0A401G8R7_9APHY|nr:hypothetical protein SCP_0114410 [Sparassis crispa]GBE78552.1 hypothetical protein SCP_0114410 [Sparassis crispa]